MKRLLSVLLFAAMAQFAYAADGYKIKVKITDVNMKDSMIFLAHYYAKTLPTIYKTDSAVFDKNGVATFESKEFVNGGIYMILFSDQQTYFEFLMDNGIQMDITTAKRELPYNIKFKGSPENERFQEYVTYLSDYSAKQQLYLSQLAAAKTAADSAAVREKGYVLVDALKRYRESYIAKYPKTLLANIFSALFIPETPESLKGDTMQSFNYYKEHFWDGFDFTDDRLINTPLYESKLDIYFNKIVFPTPDSVKHEFNMLLAKTRGRKELFKYTLHWGTQFVQDSKVMGMDEVFVYLVENYHMKGDAYWMPPDILAKYIDKAQKIAPNVIGNLAPEIKMVDINKKEYKLSEIKAKYTLLVFWSPDCGGCQKEIPKIDSIYRETLKDKGVKIFAVRTEGEEVLWKNFIEKHKLAEWIHVYDPEHKSNYRAQYDVYGTPSIYLLDEKKIIIGKKLDHRTIKTVIEIQEEKEKDKKNKKS